MSSGGGSRKREKKGKSVSSSGDKRERGSDGGKSGSNKFKSKRGWGAGHNAEVKEMWDTFAGGDSEVCFCLLHFVYNVFVCMHIIINGK